MPEERGNGSFRLQILLLSHGLGAGGSALSSPTSAPRFQMRTKPTMCHCQRPITAGNVEKPEVTGVETSCLFSLGSSQEQELLQICSLSPWTLPESFQTPRSTARTSRQGSEFPCCSPSSLAGTAPRSQQPCKEQHVLLWLIWALSYPGDDQNSPEIELFPVLPAEIAPHYYGFKVTSVPSLLPDFFLCQNRSEIINMSIWV